MNNERYLEYQLAGFSGLNLKENSEFQVSNEYIKNIYLNDDLSKFKVVLNDGISYNEHGSAIEMYLNHIFLNLIINTEADISMPIRRLEMVHDGSKIEVYDNIYCRDSLSIMRTSPAEDIYDKIVNSQTDFENSAVIYERIFKTLHNPNLIVQFMSFYQLLMELLANNGQPKQKDVIDYFKNNENKYPFITFEPTRKPNVRIQFDEDSFTSLRNEIGHSEDTNDMDSYKSLGSKVNSRLIKNLVQVINDILINTN